MEMLPGLISIHRNDGDESVVLVLTLANRSPAEPTLVQTDGTGACEC